MWNEYAKLPCLISYRYNSLLFNIMKFMEQSVFEYVFKLTIWKACMWAGVFFVWGMFFDGATKLGCFLSCKTGLFVRLQSFKMYHSFRIFHTWILHLCFANSGGSGYEMRLRMQKTGSKWRCHFMLKFGLLTNCSATCLALSVLVCFFYTLLTHTCKLDTQYIDSLLNFVLFIFTYN